MEVPQQLQDKLAQFQALQNQIQMLALQKQQILVHSNDIDGALEELNKIKGGERIYRMAGPLLIETSKEDSVKKLGDDKEVTKTRLSILDKQEKKLSTKFQELRSEIQSMLKPADKEAG